MPPTHTSWRCATGSKNVPEGAPLNPLPGRARSTLNVAPVLDLMDRDFTGIVAGEILLALGRGLVARAALLAAMRAQSALEPIASSSLPAERLDRELIEGHDASCPARSEMD